MPMVKVWNENVVPFKQAFQGREIQIGAKGWIWMDQDEAHAFQGSYFPPVFDADGKDQPEGFKMIKIEHCKDAPASPKDVNAHTGAQKIDDLVCMACRYTAAGKEDLTEHLKTHAGQALKDEAAEAEIAKRAKGKA